MSNINTDQETLALPNNAEPGNRHRLIFHSSIVAFILLSSFLYGLVKGSQKHAFASRASVQDLSESTETSTPLALPSGVVPVPMGDDTRINGRNVLMTAFFSERDITELSREQLETWRNLGMQVIEKITERRGVVVAIDQNTGEKFRLVVWQVPPPLRKDVSNGFAAKEFVYSSRSS